MAAFFHRKVVPYLGATSFSIILPPQDAFIIVFRPFIELVRLQEQILSCCRTGACVERPFHWIFELLFRIIRGKLQIHAPFLNGIRLGRYKPLLYPAEEICADQLRKQLVVPGQFISGCQQAVGSIQSPANRHGPVPAVDAITAKDSLVIAPARYLSVPHFYQRRENENKQRNAYNDNGEPHQEPSELTLGIAAAIFRIIIAVLEGFIHNLRECAIVGYVRIEQIPVETHQY